MSKRDRWKSKPHGIRRLEAREGPGHLHSVLGATLHTSYARRGRRALQRNEEDISG